MTEKKILAELRSYKKTTDNDDIRFKEIIKDKLVKNDKIIYVLNNKELVEKDSDNADYFNVNILPYYLISPTQTNVQNFICYEVQFEDVAKYNKIIKYGHIIFYILCEQKGIIEEHTGVARHDLLAALVMEEFNWKNYFGPQIKCISDKASTVDTNYACRTIVFEGEFPNSIVKTQKGVTRVINN